MSVNPFRKRPSLKCLSLLALLILLLSSAPGAGASPAPPKPPKPPAPAEAPMPPHGWLGVVLQHERGGEEGLTVIDVRDGSPAEEAGLKEGDVILELDGKKLDRSGDIRRVMRDLEPGDKVQIRIRRKDAEKTLTATLGEAPRMHLKKPLPPKWPEWHEKTPPVPPFNLLGLPRNYLGVRVQSMTEDLRAYFKAPRGRGLLVSRVEEDTPAAKAGLRAGDVIIAVGGKGIADRGDITQALSEHEPGDKVAVRIVRDGSEKTVEVEIAERPFPRRHGALFLHEGDEIDLDLERELEDLEDLEVMPEEVEKYLQESLEGVREEIHRVIREIPEYHAQAALALRKAPLRECHVKELQHKVQEALEKSREAIHRVTEAILDTI